MALVRCNDSVSEVLGTVNVDVVVIAFLEFTLDFVQSLEMRSGHHGALASRRGRLLVQDSASSASLLEKLVGVEPGHTRATLGQLLRQDSVHGA